MPSAAMTFTSLIADLKAYSERPNDANVNAQLPRIILLAEHRIAADLDLQGQQKVVKGNFEIDNPVIAKPAHWRGPVSLNYTNPQGERKQMFLRTYEYCRNFWPNPAKTGEPRFYADYNMENLFIVPTPAGARNFELVFQALRDPLSEEVQTNWATVNAPQLLLYAAMFELHLYLKNAQEASTWMQLYGEVKASLKGEDASRVSDRNAGLK